MTKASKLSHVDFDPEKNDMKVVIRFWFTKAIAYILLLLGCSSAGNQCKLNSLV